DQRIVPNGRRDHFEQNTQFLDLVNRLTPAGRELSRRCRTSSLRRNTIRQFEIAYDQVAANIAAINQGVIGTKEKKRLEKDGYKSLKRMEKYCAHSVLEQHEKTKLQSKLKRIQRRLQRIDASRPGQKSTKKLQTAEGKAFQKFASLLYECS